MAVINYRPARAVGGRASLSAIAFVPDNFRLMTKEEMAAADEINYVDAPPSQSQRPQGIIVTAENRDKILADMQRQAEEAGKSRQAEMEVSRRSAMMEGVRKQLRQPQDDEKRVIGTVEKIECGKGKVVFHIKTNNQTMKFRSTNFADVKLMIMNPEYGVFTVGCAQTIPPSPAVVTYVPDLSSKSKEIGILVAVEFVPRNFTLD